MPKNYCLEISGEYACFTRPEMKVERVSYDVITPSAARAIFEAIFWKPAIRWQITQVDVLNPIQWITLRRNEVGKVFSNPTAKQMQGQSAEAMGLYIEEERQQRAGLFLRDVKYRIYADLLFDQTKDVSASYAKYIEMFERRAQKGQCFNQPYLGCREFSCEFRLVQTTDDEPKCIPDSRQLGWMLYDLDYLDPNNPRPLFFNVEMFSGVIKVPSLNSQEIRG
jgi:CRISPR-associated protein Cas5d